MIYTPFAILAASAILIVMVFPFQYETYQQERLNSIDQLTVGAESLERSAEEVVEELAVEDLREKNQDAVDNFFDDAQQEFEEDDDLNETSEYLEWQDSFDSPDFNFDTDISVDTNTSLSNDSIGRGLDIETELEYELTQEIDGTTVADELTIDTARPLTGKDPYLVNQTGDIDEDDLEYEYCDAEQPFEELTDEENFAEDSDSTVNGEAVVRPGELSEIDGDGKILVIEDPSRYDENEFGDFNGVVSKQESDLDEASHFVMGKDDFLDIEQTEGKRLIIHENELYISRIAEFKQKGCYASSDESMSPYQRMEREEDFSDEGVVRIVNSTELTNEGEEADDVNIGIVAFGAETADTKYEIYGVSRGVDEGQEFENFRLDEQRTSEWDIVSLRKPEEE